ncbi:MAG: SirB2 family protein [Venatoribacter sp.]
MGYETLKQAHAGLAYLTILLFVLRFVLFTLAPKWKQQKVFKILPHIIDTLLLIFALLMVFSSGFHLPHSWLAAKIIGLVLYVGMGVLAIRKGSKLGFSAAVLCYLYIFGVAKYKTALSWYILF